MSNLQIAPENQLRVLARGKTVKLCRIDPCGSLYARRGTAGDVQFSWRFTFAGANDAEPIGRWDDQADPRRTAKTDLGWTVTAAIRQAESWAREHDMLASSGGFRSVLREHLESEEVRAAAVSKFTLGALMEDYALLLEAEGKAGSARDVRYAINKHVALAHRFIFEKPAVEVAPQDINAILARLMQAEHHRTASKVRSFIQTAYERAMGAAADASLERLRSYHIMFNPVKQTVNPRAPKSEAKPIKSLSLAQFRHYWKKLQKVEGTKGAALRLHVLTGGQRPAQLVRVRAADVHEDYFMMYDGKGCGDVLRPHPIPMTPSIRKALAEFDHDGNYLMSADGGRSSIWPQTLTGWAQEVVGDDIAGFNLKVVRSAVETILSSWRVEKEDRGRLQSHGIGGVQDKHYNAHEFLAHKREALEILEAILNEVLKKPPVYDRVARLVELELAQERQTQHSAATT